MRRQRVRTAIGQCRGVMVQYIAPERDSLETLKTRLLTERMQSVSDTELATRLRRAADESAALAWATAYPLLALPELLSEKLSQAQLQFEQQRRIQSRGGSTIQFAA